jgi:hypothetical protein
LARIAPRGGAISGTVIVVSSFWNRVDAEAAEGMAAG